MVLSLIGFALLLVTSARSVFMPLKRSPRPDLATIGSAVLPVAAMTALGAEKYDMGQIVLQGVVWGVVVTVVTHTLRVKVTPRLLAKMRAKRAAQ